MKMVPEISKSTVEEREAYIAEKYKCISDCDACGICNVFHGTQPEIVFKDYVEGKREYSDIIREYRK